MLWKQIKGFEQYEISDTGLVRKDGKILNPFDNGGYHRILLINGPKKQKKLIHRIVAEHFIPTNDLTLQVNHKDMNKINNHVNNLEWVTCKENIQHAIINSPAKRKQLKEDMSRIGKLYGKKNSMKTRKPVEQYTLDGEFIKRYESARDASRELDIRYKGISKCCTGGSKSYKGFLWRFASVQS